MNNKQKSGSRIAVAASLAVIIAASAPAQAEGESHRLTDAWKAALMDVEGVITPEQHSTLNSIAYHSAAARLCDGIDLDTDKVATAMNTISAPPSADMEEEHILERVAHISYTLGVTKGIFLAEGSLKKEAFCADAVKSKTEEGNDHFFK